MKKIFAILLAFLCAVQLTACKKTAVQPANERFHGASYAPWLDPMVYELDGSTLIADTNNVYALGADGNFSISYDGGTTVVKPPVVLEYGPGESYGLFVSPAKTTVVYEKSNLTYICISDDSGKTWDTNQIGSDTIMPNCAGYFIQFIDTNNGWLIAESMPLGQEPHGKLCPNRVFLTNDGGLTWKETGNTGDAGFARTISGIGFSTKDMGFISFIHEYWIGPIVYRTRDGGKTWETEQVLPGLSELYNYNTPLSPVFDGQNGILPVKLSSGGMIYYTTKDDGLTWGSGQVFIR